MPTIDGALRATAARVPESPALSFEDRSYTYAALDETVARAATVLAARGLVKGDRLALMSTNSDGFIVAFYAAHRLGLVVVPINPSSAPPELSYLVQDSGARGLIFGPELADTVNASLTEGPSEVLDVVLALGAAEGHDDLWELTRAADQAPPEVEVAESDDALILYTSGTTGQAKGALFDHHRALWVGFISVSTCGMKVEDRFLHVAPLFHAAELCIMLIPGTMIGAQHVVLNGFDPVAVLDALERERITMFFGVPTMYQFLLKVPGIESRDLSAWRTGLFGAAPMPASVVEQLVGTMPGVDFMQLCGQTEGGPGGIYSSAEQVRERPAASGRQALPFTEARVVDLDGADVAPGETGELVLRGETIMKGYWNKPEETAAALRGGWLHTGDLARLDEDGYMTLVDRIKDLIITGGHNVYSVEVENALVAHPDIVDCAVVSRRHEVYGESIVAVVTPVEGASITLADVKDFCSTRIADYKIPHDLVIRQIPRNPSGKILKHVLRAAVDPSR